MKRFRMRTLLSILLSAALIAGEALPVLAMPSEEPVEQVEEFTLPNEELTEPAVELTEPDVEDLDDVQDNIQVDGLLPDNLSDPDEKVPYDGEGNGDDGKKYKKGYHSIPNDFPAVDDNLDYNTVRSALYKGREGEYYSTYLNAYENTKSVPSAYPASYNGDWLNKLNAKFPGTRNQNPYGTCWAHSTMALAEFDLISQGKATKADDCSELHMAYWCYTNGTPSIAGNTGDSVKFTATENVENILDEGGNLIYSAQTLMRQRGVAREEVAPYSQAGYIATGGKLYSSTERDDTFYLKNAYEINIKENPTQVKEAIVAHGAVGVSILAEQYYYNNTNNCFYCPGNYYTDHAVSVVGWDDNFPSSKFGPYKPSGNGAWLIRNSWTDYTEESFNSYFWLSYEDGPLEGAWVFEMDTSFPYDNHYYYDSQIHSAGYYYNTTHYANIYTVKGDADYQKLDAVSFEVSRINGSATDYTVKIYKNPKAGNPTSGELVSDATTTGKIAYIGDYTVPLESPVILEKGDTFAVVVIFAKSGFSVGLEFGFNDWEGLDVRVGCAQGQSFTSNNGSSWSDCANSTKGSANLVISALTTDVTGTDLSSLTLSPKTLDFTSKDDTHTLTATVLNKKGKKDSTAKVSFVSSNPSVVSVTGSGQSATVKALSSGTATITATSGDLSDTCSVTVSLKAKAPTANKASGNVAAGSGITLSSATKDADIYYTLDGSTPSKSSDKYTSPIQITKDMIDTTITLKAIAVADGYEDSDIVVYQYNIIDTLARIELSKDSLTLTVENEKRDIYATVYDEDGNKDTGATVTWSNSNPKVISLEENGKAATILPLSSGTAVLTATSGDMSADCQITVSLKAKAPTASKETGSKVPAGSSIILSCTTKDAEIYYTLNGSTPSKSSEKYTSPIQITKDMIDTTITLKAIAVAEGYEESDIAEYEYSVIDTLARVELSEYSLSFDREGDKKTLEATVYDEDGNVDRKANVNWSSSNGDVALVTDGTVISKGDGTAYIKAESGEMSAVCEVTVAIEDTAAPVITLPGVSPLKTGDKISITCDTQGATIYYTLDGSEPTTSSSMYRSPIKITRKMAGTNVVIKAAAKAAGMKLSAISSKNFAVEEGSGLPDVSPLDPTPDLESDILYLVKGQKFMLPKDLEGYYSFDPTVVSVSKKGQVVAKNTGLTWLMDPNSSDSYEVYVTDPVFDKKSISLVCGDSAEITLTMADGYVDYSDNYPVYWISDSPSVARIDADENICRVYGVSKGSTTVNAYVNGKAFKTRVSVTETGKVRLDGYVSSITLSPMQSVKLNLKGVSFINAEWESSTGMEKASYGKNTVYYDGIVQVTSAGMLTAAGSGTTTLYCMDNGVEIEVTVREPADRVMYLNVGKKQGLKYNGVKKPGISWECVSNDSAIDGFALMKSGTVVGMNAGCAEIEGTYDPFGEMGDGFVYKVQVYVENPKLKTDSQLTASNQTSYAITMHSGDSYALEFVNEGSYALYQPVIFTSNKPDLVIADETGEIIAKNVTKKSTANLSAKISGKKYTIKVTLYP